MPPEPSYPTGTKPPFTPKVKPTIGYKSIMGIAEMTQLAAESKEMLVYLGRPPGTQTDDLKEPYKSRARRCYELAMAGTARYGELWDIAVGKHDDKLQFNLDKGAPMGARGRLPDTCIDCGTDISDTDSRLKSDPRRCAPCRRVKKKEYNTTQRARGKQPAPGVDSVAEQVPEPPARVNPFR
jgi:hypothetical protein